MKIIDDVAIGPTKQDTPANVTKQALIESSAFMLEVTATNGAAMEAQSFIDVFFVALSEDLTAADVPPMFTSNSPNLNYLRVELQKANGAITKRVSNAKINGGFLYVWTQNSTLNAAVNLDVDVKEI